MESMGPIMATTFRELVLLAAAFLRGLRMRVDRAAFSFLKASNRYCTGASHFRGPSPSPIAISAS
jgi:hypothetical protein